MGEKWAKYVLSFSVKLAVAFRAAATNKPLQQ